MRSQIPLLFQRLSHLTLREWILRPYCIGGATATAVIVIDLPAGRLWRPTDVSHVLSNFCFRARLQF